LLAQNTFAIAVAPQLGGAMQPAWFYASHVQSGADQVAHRESVLLGEPR
jgi:hypothetical protein